MATFDELYNQLKDKENFQSLFENKDDFYEYLNTNQNADTYMNDMFGVANASQLVKKKDNADSSLNYLGDGGTSKPDPIPQVEKPKNWAILSPEARQKWEDEHREGLPNIFRGMTSEVQARMMGDQAVSPEPSQKDLLDYKYEQETQARRGVSDISQRGLEPSMTVKAAEEKAKVDKRLKQEKMKREQGEIKAAVRYDAMGRPTTKTESEMETADENIGKLTSKFNDLLYYDDKIRTGRFYSQDDATSTKNLVKERNNEIIAGLKDNVIADIELRIRDNYDAPQQMSAFGKLGKEGIFKVRDRDGYLDIDRAYLDGIIDDYFIGKKPGEKGYIPDTEKGNEIRRKLRGTISGYFRAKYLAEVESRVAEDKIGKFDFDVEKVKSDVEGIRQQYFIDVENYKHSLESKLKQSFDKEKASMLEQKKGLDPKMFATTQAYEEAVNAYNDRILEFNQKYTEQATQAYKELNQYASERKKENTRLFEEYKSNLKGKELEYIDKKDAAIKEYRREQQDANAFDFFKLSSYGNLADNLQASFAGVTAAMLDYSGMKDLDIKFANNLINDIAGIATSNQYMGRNISKARNFSEGFGAFIQQMTDQVPTIGMAMATQAISGNPYLTSSVMMYSDMAREAFNAKQDILDNGGSQSEVDAAIKNITNVHLAMAPLYFAEGSLLFGSGAKVGSTSFWKNWGSGSLKDYPIEAVQELIQEYTSAVNTGSAEGKSFNQWLVTDGKNVAIDVLPTVVAFGAGSSIQQTRSNRKIENEYAKASKLLGDKAKIDYVNDLYTVMGENATFLVPDMLLNTGEITKEEHAALVEQMPSYIQKIKETQEAGLMNRDDSRYYASRLMDKEQAQRQLEAATTPSGKKKLENKIKNIDKELEDLINGKEVSYSKIKYANGRTAIVSNDFISEQLESPKSHWSKILTNETRVNGKAVPLATLETENEQINKKLNDQFKNKEQRDQFEGVEGGNFYQGSQKINFTNDMDASAVSEETGVDEDIVTQRFQEARDQQARLDQEAPGVEIVLLNDEEYQKAMKSKTIKGDVNSNGNFSYDFDETTKTYKAQIQINLGKANSRTIAHETAHALMLKRFGEDLLAYEDFQKGLQKVMKASDVISLLNFASNYDRYSRKEEFMAEFAGRMAAAYNEVQNAEGKTAELQKTKLQRVASYVSDFVSKMTNGTIVPFKDLKNTDEAIEFFNSFSKSLNKDAVQEQTTSEVPLQPETRVGEEMEERAPEAEPQVAAQKGEVEQQTQEEVIEELLTTEDVEGREIEEGYEVMDEVITIDAEKGKVDRGPQSKAQVNRDFEIAENDFVDVDTINGKKAVGFLGDTQVAGTVQSPDGTELKGDGGPGYVKYANRNLEVDENGFYKGRAAVWASTFEDSTTKLMKKFANAELALIGTQQTTGVLGNRRMLMHFGDLMNAAVERGIDEQEILTEINSKLDTNFKKDTPIRQELGGVENFTSIDEFIDYLDPFLSKEDYATKHGKEKLREKPVTYDLRNNIFGKIFNIGNHQKFGFPSVVAGKNYNYDKTILEYANDEMFQDAGYGDFVGYVEYDAKTLKIEKVDENSDFYNPSYPYVITAEGVRNKFFNNFIDGRAVFYDTKPTSLKANQTPFGLRKKDQAARAIMGAMPQAEIQAEAVKERQAEFEPQSKSQIDPTKLLDDYRNDISNNVNQKDAYTNLLEQGASVRDIKNALPQAMMDPKVLSDALEEVAMASMEEMSKVVETNLESINQKLEEMSFSNFTLEEMYDTLKAEGFRDFEISNAFINGAYGTNEELIEILGTDYNKTIENILDNQEMFPVDYVEDLKNRNTSVKKVQKMNELREAFMESGMMFSDAVSVVDYLSEKLSDSMPAIQAVRDQLEQLLEKPLETDDTLESFKELASRAGRILNMARGILKKDLGDIIQLGFEKQGIVLTEKQKQTLNNLIEDFQQAKQRETEALQSIEDGNISDQDIEAYKAAQKEVGIANIYLSKFINDRMPTFWNERITSLGSRSLLNLSTVVLSAVSNVENNLVSSGLPFKAVMGIRDSFGKGIKGNTLSIDNWRMARKLSKKDAATEMSMLAKYGNVNMDNKTMLENIGSISGFRDGKLLTKAITAYVKKATGKENYQTVEEWTDALDATMIKAANGELKIRDGKTYNFMRSLFWGMNPGSYIAEGVGRSMAFGGDIVFGKMAGTRGLIDYLNNVDNTQVEGSLFENLLKDKNGKVSENTIKAIQSLMTQYSELGREFEQLGLSRVFMQDNYVSSTIGKGRKATKSKISRYYKQIQTGKSKNKLFDEVKKQAFQALDVTLWTLMPFTKVPVNFLGSALVKISVPAAMTKYVYQELSYQTQYKNFQKKYPAGTKLKTQAQKLQYETDRVSLFKAKRQAAYDMSQVMTAFGYQFLGSSAAFIGAYMKGDDEKEREVYERLGLKGDHYNFSLHMEFLGEVIKTGSYEKARLNILKNRGPKLWVDGDIVSRSGNLGFYGYAMGVYGNIDKAKKLDKDRALLDLFSTEKGFGALYFTQTLGTGIENIPMLQGISRLADVFQDMKSDKSNGKIIENFVASTTATALSPFFPSFGSVVSKGNADVIRNPNEIFPDTEGAGWSSVFNKIAFRVLRNVPLSLESKGEWNQFYKAKLSAYGQELKYKSTVADEGSVLSYFQAALDPFNVRPLKSQDSKPEPIPELRKIDNDPRLKNHNYFDPMAQELTLREVEKVSKMFHLYENLTGRPYKMTTEGKGANMNNFLAHSMSNKMKYDGTGFMPLDVKEDEPQVLSYNLPDELFRREVVIRGKYLAEAVASQLQFIDTIEKDFAYYLENGETEEAIKIIERTLEDHQNIIRDAEEAYRTDYVANRENAYLKYMYKQDRFDEEQINNLKRIGTINEQGVFMD